MINTKQTNGIGGHHLPHRGRTDDWLTPPEIIRAMGPFDLDPCCPPNMPWRTADRMLTVDDDGFKALWRGRVWLNPPYGPETGRWLEKLSIHGDGMALIFARTETEMFFKWGWEKADAMLFIKGRLHFHSADGKRAKANAGGPSVLIAYGEQNVAALKRKIAPVGQFVDLTNRRTP